MRNILIGLCLLLTINIAYAGNLEIRETMSNGHVYSGYEFKSLVVQDEPAYSGVTPSALVWYVDNLMGYSSVGIDGFEASTGTVPTTINAQAVYPDGTDVSVNAQTITAGTDLTTFHSPWYKFTLPAGAATRNISFIFNVAD